MPELFESNLMSATSIDVTANDKIIILLCEYYSIVYAYHLISSIHISDTHAHILYI